MFSAKAQANKPAAVIDLDGTIAREDSRDLMANEPEPGAREALQRLKDAGFEVVVYTCRTNSRSTPDVEGEASNVKEWLDRHEIPYDRIDLGYEGKPHAQVYIDNKAMRYEGGAADWENVVDAIMAGVGHG